MDLSAARTELQARGFTYLSTGRTDIMLNQGKNAFEDEPVAWPWLEATTSGTSPVTISDLKYIEYVIDTTTGAVLTGVDPRDVPDIDPVIAQVGTPAVWWLDGTSTLKTYPTSSSASLSVRYIKFSPELSGSTDTPLIPVRYHSLWIDYAVIEAYKDSDRFREAQELMQLCRNYRLPQLVQLYGLRNLANPGYQNIHWQSDDW